MKLTGELALGQELGDPAGRGDVTGGERGQRRHVQLLRVTGLCDRLAVLVDDKHRLRIRVSLKDVADTVDLLQLLLVHDELLDHRALAP